MTVRVLIAEDHTLVSEGLRAMLSTSEEIEVVGTVDAGEEAIRRVESGAVDVVLMDLKLSDDTSGLDATRRIKRSAPNTKVVVLSMFTDPGTVAEAVKAGADGYLSKGTSGDEVIRAIKKVMEGNSVLDPSVTEGVLGRMGRESPTALTDRELDVLQRLAHGRSTKEVAAEIAVSEETVKSHVKQIFKKLGVRDRTQAVAEALRRGLVH